MNYSGLCSPETPNLTELAESVDDTLFQRIMHNPHHVLYMYHLLPERRELVYNIRSRHHDRQLSIISGQLRKRNFIYRMFSCSKTLINCFITVFTRVLFIRIFTCILILCRCVLLFCVINEYVCVYVCMYVCMYEFPLNKYARAATCGPQVNCRL